MLTATPEVLIPRKLLDPPDDPEFKPHNKIRGSDYEGPIVEMLVRKESFQKIQAFAWDTFQFKVGYHTIEHYVKHYFEPDSREATSKAVLGIKKAEKALQISEKLKEQLFTDLLSRTDQLKQDIRILDALINRVGEKLLKTVEFKSSDNSDGEEEDTDLVQLLADPRQQMTLKSLIEARDKLRGQLNTELNNPQSFDAMKLVIMKQVSTKCVLRYAPWVAADKSLHSPAKAKELLEEIKADIRYL